MRQLITVITVFLTVQVASSQVLLDKIVAVIGDEIILKSEYDAYTAMRLSGIGVQSDSSTISKYKKQFLQEMIDGKVLIAHAKKDSTIKVTDIDVDNALNNHIQMLMRQNNLTMETLELELKRQQGTTFAKFKSDLRSAIREQLLKQRVQQNYLSSTKVSRKDVENFYNEFKDSLPQAGPSVLLQKLSLKIAPTDSIRQAAFDKINSIKQRLDNGEDFAELAKKYSESPDASEGGNLGFIAKGTLNELAFEEKAFSLLPGQISEPFQTRLGFHIVNVIEKRDQKVNIRQIFVKVAPPDFMIKKVTDKLDSIRSSCKTVEEFSKLVSEMSIDPSSKVNSGKLGWISLIDMEPALRDAVDGLDAGSITKPVFEDNIVSIYRIDDKVEKRALTLDNDYMVLAEKAKDIFAQKKLLDLVSRWKDEILIDIRL